MKKTILTICLLLLAGCGAEKAQPKTNLLLGDTTENYYTTAGDGYVYASVDDTSAWSLAHDAATGYGYNYTNNICYIAAGDNGLLNKWDIRRVFLPFDTSNIPSGAVILNASVWVYTPSSGIINATKDGLDYAAIVQTSQASSSVLSSADYNNAGATTSPALGSPKYSLQNMSNTGSYNEYVLNATGISWIKKEGDVSNCGTKEGITCLGIREGHDIENSSAGINILGFNTYEYVSSTGQPYMTITYILPDGDLNIKSGSVYLKSGTLEIKS